MENQRVQYMPDDYGNAIYAEVAWMKGGKSPKPIALVFHGGGLLVGSAAVIPKIQVQYLAEKGFVVVIPNYRLSPQVSGKTILSDCEGAFDWAVKNLPEILQTQHGIEVDTSRVVAMGHSSGGTIAMHIASCRPVKAITAFYPSLFLSDTTTSAHKPTSAPPFAFAPDFHPTDEEWKTNSPPDLQICEAPFPAPGTAPSPRSRWQMHILKNGLWMNNVQPDGDLDAIDPMTRITASWPPTLIVQGEIDDAPGSGLELARRAEAALQAAGVTKVQLEIVQDASHMFDLPPIVGSSELGPKWKAVVKGLDWLCEHAER